MKGKRLGLELTICSMRRRTSCLLSGTTNSAGNMPPSPDSTTPYSQPFSWRRRDTVMGKWSELLVVPSPNGRRSVNCSAKSAQVNLNNNSLTAAHGREKTVSQTSQKLTSLRSLIFRLKSWTQRSLQKKGGSCVKRGRLGGNNSSNR